MITFLRKLYSLFFKNQETQSKKEILKTPKVEIQENPTFNYSSKETKENTSSFPLPEEPLEKYLVETLKKLNIPNSKIYWNCYIPCKPYCNITFTEIDVALVTPKGLIIFESKHYNGTIEGDFNSSNWSVSYVNGAKYKAANAIRQNYHHTNAIIYNTNLSRDKIIPIAYLNCTEFLGDTGSATVIFHNDRNINTLEKTIQGLLTRELSFREYTALCTILENGMYIDKKTKEEHLEKLKNYIDNQ